MWSVDVTLSQTLAMTLDQTHYCPHSVHTISYTTNELVTNS